MESLSPSCDDSTIMLRVHLYLLQGRWTSALHLASPFEAPLSETLYSLICPIYVLLLIGTLTSTKSPQYASCLTSSASASSFQVHEYFTHDTLWLVAGEVDYLAKRHGAAVLAQYLLHLQEELPLLNNDDDLQDDTSVDRYRGEAIDSFVSQVTGEAASQPQYPSTAAVPASFLRDAIELHAKLAVFFDELGDLAASQRHHAQFCRLALETHPSVPPAALLLLLPRAVLASPTVYAKDQECTSLRLRQFAALQEMYSARLGPVVPLTAEAAGVVAFERHFTSTPPSMLVGYNAPDTALDMQVMSAVEALLDSIVPSTVCTPPAGSMTADNTGVLRVGFVSCFLYTHSVCRLVNNVILALSARPDLEVQQ